MPNQEKKQTALVVNFDPELGESLGHLLCRTFIVLFSSSMIIAKYLEHAIHSEYLTGCEFHSMWHEDSTC